MDEGTPQIETRADLEMAVAGAGVPMPSDYQLERWRGAGLLPSVEQIQIPYNGSIVEFPTGTAKQIIEIQRLLKINKRFGFVGWELWFAGHSVDEKYWKQKIEIAVKPFDQELARLNRHLIAEEESDDLVEKRETMFDQISKHIGTSKLFSRIGRRISLAQRAIVLRILTDVGRGRYHDFALPNSSSEKSEQDILTEAFDLNDSNSHRKSEKYYLDPENSESTHHNVLGHRLQLERELPTIFNGISGATLSGDLAQVLEYPDSEVEAARNDVRNAIQIALCLYDTLSYGFGKRAFGLRLIAWLARRSTAEEKAFWIATVATMRRSGSTLLPSVEIDEMAKNAVKMHATAEAFMKIVESNPQLKERVTPKALRLAFSNTVELKKFEKMITIYSNPIGPTP